MALSAILSISRGTKVGFANRKIGGHGMKKTRIKSMAALTGLAVLTWSVGGSSVFASTAQPLAAHHTMKRASYSQGASNTQIVLGTSGPLTGPIAAYGAIAQGENAYFNFVNSKGGINHRKIKLIMLDDQYQPDKAVANARALVSDGIFAAVGTLGTATNQAADPFLLRANIPVTSVATGSSALTVPVVPLRFGLEPTYTLEGHVMTRWAIMHNHIKTIGVFYQNDDFGKEGLNAIVQEAARYHVRVVAKVAYNATDTDFSTYALNMKRAHPQAVFEIGVPEPTAMFEIGMMQLGFHPQQYVTYVSGDPIMFKLAGKAFDGAYTDGWLPLLNSPKTATFRAWFKKTYPNTPPTLLALSGWVDAQVVAHGLAMCGNTLTTANFIKQMNSIRNWRGADTSSPVTYTPTNHFGVDAMYMLQADGKTKQLVPKSGLIFYHQVGSSLN
ncbi:hypothetical protein ATW55_02195 [Ferroacidibacillus organovorans]|uniref:Leucine-binding protein domain-containing protein n=2 Tax=Ferroacidibacillus organovorans TaxID=1765683 RepID=A0A117SX35_9BACL|nr:hypothetical protein ATW55_02195 [Ferroacidibacillus organovorans]